MSQGTVVADDLRAWREKHGVSQSEAANLLSVPVKTLQHWEAGHACAHGNLLRAHLRLLTYVWRRANQKVS